MHRSPRHNLLPLSQHLRQVLLPVICCAVCGGCNPSAASKSDPLPSIATKPASRVVDSAGIVFSDVTRQRGLLYTWPQQPRPMRTTESFGCGCAAFDADNDGWQDILLVADPNPLLYRNKGGGRFEDVTAPSGLASFEEADWTGCAIGDVDGDGLLDVLLTGFHRLALFRNVGDLRFELVTEESGLDPANHGHWGASAGFMDLDGDGWLDLVIVNYVDFGPQSRQYCENESGVRSGCRPQEYPAERGEIWRNTGQGRFELVPDSAGMGETKGVALVLAFIDLDEDGRMDFYIGNDGTPSEMMHNLGNMQFENVGFFSGLATDEHGIAAASMGADWADFDRDGQMDLAISNFQHLCFPLFRNQGDQLFVNIAYQTGLAQVTKHFLGFGTKWVDFENDGWPDLFFVNGHVYHNAAEFEGPNVRFRQPILLLHNLEGKQFVDLTPAMESAVGRPMVGRGAATLDFDNDGRVDLLGVDYEGPPLLLENRTHSDNHWLKLDLRSRAPNVFAYGARAIGRAGDQLWVGLVSPATSYLSSSDPRIHWGLGATAELDELVVTWPSGQKQTLHNVKGNQTLRIEEPAPATTADR